MLCESDVVRGEFGHAELMLKMQESARTVVGRRERKIRRTFATELIGDFDRWVAAENRSARVFIALRKLDDGEDLGNGEAE